MADYYPLLSRAVAGLDPSTPEARGALYDRAREALIAQLRSLDPPLSESDVARERLALEAVLRRVEDEATGRAGAAVPGAAPAAAPAPAEAPRERPRLAGRPPPKGAARRLAPFAVGAGLALAVGLVAALALRTRDAPEGAGAPVAGSSAPAEGAPARDAEGKSADRLGPAGAGGAARPRAEVAVAGRAALLVESPADAGAVATRPATVTWRADSASGGEGRPLETVLRATVVAEGHLKLDLVVRRNLDPALPASHTVEMAFAPTPGGEVPAVREVSLLEARAQEGERGTPLAGLPVPVADNLFLIGLSGAGDAPARNLALLRERGWLYFEMRLTNSRRAALLFEKGAGGDQALRDALSAWGQ